MERGRAGGSVGDLAPGGRVGFVVSSRSPEHGAPELDGTLGFKLQACGGNSHRPLRSQQRLEPFPTLCPTLTPKRSPVGLPPVASEMIWGLELASPATSAQTGHTCCSHQGLASPGPGVPGPLPGASPGALGGRFGGRPGGNGSYLEVNLKRGCLLFLFSLLGHWTRGGERGVEKPLM